MSKQKLVEFEFEVNGAQDEALYAKDGTVPGTKLEVVSRDASISGYWFFGWRIRSRVVVKMRVVQDA